MRSNYENIINSTKTSLGIELGSTRIKSVLIDDEGSVLATGYYDWENEFNDGVWTYAMSSVWTGVQASYKQLKDNVQRDYGITITKIGSIGISAMMHGYLPFDKDGNQLTEFRTWRNSMTADAEEQLTELLNHNIPQRWSVAHMYQAILNEESHVSEIDFLTTLSGYVHWQLTGEKVLGIGDASGMFPIDSNTKQYNCEMLQTFNDAVNKKGYTLKLENVLPTVAEAGKVSGTLTEAGAKLLDLDNDLESGIIFAPPEGDAGTGMVATNSVAKRTGNISAGTSVFAMVVLEEQLKKVYPEIDIVVTPAGSQVAMVHVNNCTTEINSWVNLFAQFATMINSEVSTDDLYTTLFNAALESDETVNGILSYGYHSGENITKVETGRPLLVRKPDANFTVNNLMRSILDSAFATLNIGLDILSDEGVEIDSMLGHGGIFKTDHVAQKIVATAVGSPLSVMKTANEGGAWGMAILASFVHHSETMILDEYLNNVIFNNSEVSTYSPTDEEIKKYNEYVTVYKTGLEIEKSSSVLK